MHVIITLMILHKVLRCKDGMNWGMQKRVANHYTLFTSNWHKYTKTVPKSKFLTIIFECHIVVLSKEQLHKEI